MSRVLRDAEDAFGHALMDHLEHGRGAEIIERSDGYIDLSAAASDYFRRSEEWSAHTRQAVAGVRGRALDVGCGAGRIALHLQEQGHEVVAIDISPLAIEVCRLRGVRDARLLPIHRVSPGLGRFDTVLMMGNNFGLFANGPRARRLLRRFHRTTARGGRIIAETLDPYRTEDAFHLAYHEQNRRRGRMPGQIRMRVRYKGYRTPWFDYLFVSEEELHGLVLGTGWHAAEILRSEGAVYTAVLEKV